MIVSDAMEKDSLTVAIILGVIQGISEFLPVSSSGHLIIVSWLMEGKALPLSVNTALHFGTLLSVLIYFWKDWFRIVVKTKSRVLQGEKSWETGVLLPALILGSVPAGVIGITGRKTIEVLFHNPLSVAVPLFLVGFLLWWVDRTAASRRGFRELRLVDGLLIGLAQACALIPGVSRSGATITAARSLGLDRDAAARFSFMLGTPAMGGAALLHMKDFLISWNQPGFLAGVGTSFVVGCLAIRFFLQFIKKSGFLVFALYRALVSLILVWLFL